MILKNVAGGYRVRWREQGALRQQTVATWDEARKLDAQKVLKRRGRPRRHEPLGPRDVSVAEFAEQWIEQRRIDVRPKTLASFRETTYRYILPVLGAVQVRDVEADDIETVLRQAVARSKRGSLSKNTLRIIRATASLLFKAAVKDKRKLLDANPCKSLDVKLGRLSQEDRTKSIRAMTYAQLGQFLRAARRHCTRRDYALFHTLADTGARPSEVLSLKWSDLDVDRRTVTIVSTKTDTKRIMRLTVPLADVLGAWRRTVRRRPEPSEYVFPSRRTGEPLNVKRVGRQFRTLLKKAGLSRFKLYDVRHTFASHLLDQGVKITDVAYALGHAKPTTTLTFYAHSLQNDMAYIDRLTTAREQAGGDLNGDVVRTKKRTT